jgi:hypothetical protein
MDLRFLTQPILLGHYEQDPIAGAEALIDRELLDGDLSERYNLGPLRRSAAARRRSSCAFPMRTGTSTAAASTAPSSVASVPMTATSASGI